MSFDRGKAMDFPGTDGYGKFDSQEQYVPTLKNENRTTEKRLS